jgi:hypothetical protein
MEQDGIVSHLPGAPKGEDGCKRELDVFAGVEDKAGLPATHRGRNGVKFKINRLPPNLTHIGNWAFQSCSGLTEIALPPGLTHIGDRAFHRCPNIKRVLITPDLAHRGPIAVLDTDTVRSLKASGATVRGWAPLTLTTLGGDAVEIQLTLPKKVSADYNVGTALASAAAAKLGVPPEELYIAAAVKDVVLFRPTISVSVVVLDADGRHTRADRAIAVTLATECGPTDAVDATIPTTVRYAARKIAETVFGIPGLQAVSAVRLHVEVDGAVAAVGADQLFRKLGDRDLDTGLAAAGIADGVMLGVTPRKRGWRRRRTNLAAVFRGEATTGGQQRLDPQSSESVV